MFKKNLGQNMTNLFNGRKKAKQIKALLTFEGPTKLGMGWLEPRRKLQLRVQSNSVMTNSSGPAIFVRYNRGSL
jgi:hypothetical protein